MVGISVLSLLGGGLFAYLAKEVLTIGEIWISAILWIAAGGAIFWVLWDCKKTYAAREKAQSDSRDNQDKSVREGIETISAVLTGMQEELTAAHLAQKENLDGLQETLNLLIRQVKEADMAVQTALRDGQNARERVLRGLAEQLSDCKNGISDVVEKADGIIAALPAKDMLEGALQAIPKIKKGCDAGFGKLVENMQSLINSASGIQEQLTDCKNSISDVAEKADDILAALPAKGMLEDALQDISEIQEGCDAGSGKLGENTESLQKVAEQIKAYNENYRQNLEDVDKRIECILDLLTNHYQLLKQIGEQYQCEKSVTSGIN